jgi:hypothetical protein
MKSQNMVATNMPIAIFIDRLDLPGPGTPGETEKFFV